MLSHVVRYSTWQLVAQILSASTMLVLTALLPASPLATYGYALSLSSLASSFATLRLEQAILVARSDTESDDLAWGGLVSALVLATAMVILDQAGAFGDQKTGSYTAGAISAFAMSAVNISQQVLIRRDRSGYAGRIAVFRSFVVSACVVAFASLGSRVNANAVLLGLSIASGMVAGGCLVEVARITGAGPSFGSMRATVQVYSDVWTSYLGQSVLSGISLNAPYFAIFHFAEPRYAAAYLLADRVVRMPVTLLSNSVRSHLTHQFRLLIERGQVHVGKGILWRWSISLAAIGWVVLLLGGWTLWMFGAHLSEEKWRQAGMAVMVMSAWGGSVISNPPASATLTAYRKTGYIFRMQGAELLLRVVIIAVAALYLFKGEFYLGLFLIFVPGIFYNLFLWREASQAWKTSC